VGVLCHRDTVWVYNPAYAFLPTGAGAGVPEPQRLLIVSGMSNVTCLLDSTGFSTVNSLYIQGLDVPVQNSIECIGHSAQWVDNVTRASTATYPFSAGYFQPGQVLPGYYLLQHR
jgi:hypothetical protein